MVHPDNQYDPGLVPAMASMIALEDFGEDIGATNIVPGSHEWARERQPEPQEVAIAEMPAGSAAIYLGSTLHASIHWGTPSSPTSTRATR